MDRQCRQFIVLKLIRGAHGPPHRRSLGTGDFRIFVGDSRGKQVKTDEFAPTTDYSQMDKFLSSAPFDSYAGYDTCAHSFNSFNSF